MLEAVNQIIIPAVGVLLTIAPIAGTIAIAEATPPHSNALLAQSGTSGKKDYKPGGSVSATWKVVDPDPKGLNCRANIPPTAGSKQVVRVFKQGEILTAVKPVRGIESIVFDETPQKSTWLRIQLNQGECWVRANSAFVVPVTTSAKPQKTAPKGICIVSDPSGTPLNVRDKPNGKAIGSYRNGDGVVVESNSGNWSLVYPQSKASQTPSGWVFSDYLTQCSGG